MLTGKNLPVARTTRVAEDQMPDNNPSIELIGAELIENARRSGARNIAVWHQHGLMVVSDDGEGIRDPGLLVNAGISGWNDRMAAEAPRGTGLFQTAGRGLRIQTLKAGCTPWTSRLDGQMWETGAMAEIRAGSRLLPGTTASVPCNEEEYRKATKRIGTIPQVNLTVDGEALHEGEQRSRPWYTETAEGLTISVWKSHAAQPTTVDLLGRLISVEGAAIRTLDGAWWHTRAEITDRRWISRLDRNKRGFRTVEGARLVRACRAAQLRAMENATRRPPVDRETAVEARRIGVLTLRASIETLQRWRPEGEAESRRTRTVLIRPGHWNAAELQMIAAAADNSVTAIEFRREDPAYRGWPEYDELNTLSSITLTQDGPDAGEGPRWIPNLRLVMELWNQHGEPVDRERIRIGVGWRTDPTGRHVVSNLALDPWCGLEREEIIRRCVAAHHGEETDSEERDQIERWVDQLLQDGGTDAKCHQQALETLEKVPGTVRRLRGNGGR